MSRMVDEFDEMFPLENDVELPDPLQGAFEVCATLAHDAEVPDAIREKVIRRTVEQFPKAFAYATNWERDLTKYEAFVFDINMLIDNFKIRCAPYELG